MTAPTAGQLGWRAPVSVHLSPPIMVAQAAIPGPVVITNVSLQVATAMRATATVLAPTIGVTFTVPVPVMAALAAMRTPTVGIGKTVTAPLMAAVAAMLTPTVSAAVAVTAVPMAAAAAMLAPTTSIVTGPPIAFDTVGTGAHAFGASLSWTQIVAAGAAVYAVLSTDRSAAISALTFGGIAMTLVGSIPLNNSASQGLLSLYKLVGAPAGTQTGAATFGTSTNGSANTISYTGGAGSVGPPSTVFGSSTALSQSLACSSGQIILQAFATRSGMGASAGGTQRYILTTAVPGIAIQDSTASATFTATANSSVAFAGIGVVLS